MSNDLSGIYTEIDCNMNYLGVPYMAFLKYARQRAYDNGWGVHSLDRKGTGFDVCPDWDFALNKTKGEEGAATWTPHLPIPWLS
jgi:hypothetical protein